MISVFINQEITFSLYLPAHIILRKSPFFNMLVLLEVERNTVLLYNIGVLVLTTLTSKNTLI